MGVHNTTASVNNDCGVNVRHAGRIMDSPPALAVRDMNEVAMEEVDGMVKDWIEVWDYVGGNRFRGFVAEKDGEKTMFVFFDPNVIGSKIKAG